MGVKYQLVGALATKRAYSSELKEWLRLATPLLWTIQRFKTNWFLEVSMHPCFSMISRTLRITLTLSSRTIRATFLLSRRRLSISLESRPIMALITHYHIKGIRAATRLIQTKKVKIRQTICLLLSRTKTTKSKSQFNILTECRRRRNSLRWVRGVVRQYRMMTNETNLFITL